MTIITIPAPKKKATKPTGIRQATAGDKKRKR